MRRRAIDRRQRERARDDDYRRLGVDPPRRFTQEEIDRLWKLRTEPRGRADDDPPPF